MNSDYMPPPSELPPGSIVWAYLRDSGGDSQEQSVSQQRSELKTYCSRYGLNLAHVFADEAKSGTTEVGRDAFHDMIDMSADTCPVGILIWNFARFGRDFDDSTYYKAMLRKRGAIVHSITDPIPAGQYGRVVETIIDITNQEKSRQTSRDVKRALQALVRQGFSCGGRTPTCFLSEKVTIGMKRNGEPRVVSRWIPDPDKWELGQLAFRLRRQGKPFKALMEATGGRLFKTKNSWTDFFTNKSYIGIGKCGELEIPNHHPAMVDMETWEAVQLVQRTNRMKAGNSLHPGRISKPTLLSGLAVCIHCGDAIVYDETGKNNWPSYLCGRKRRQGYHSCAGRLINSRVADGAVINAVLGRVFTHDYVTALLDEVRAKFSDTDALDRENERLLRQKTECERAITNLLDLAESFGARAAAERLRERETEKERVVSDLRQVELKRKAARLEVTPDALGLALAAWSGELAEMTEMGDILAVKNYLKRFVAKVELGYNTARIWYTYPIDALPVDAVFPRGDAYLLTSKAILVSWK
jgi:site-specific DNA recombinase